MTAKFKSLVLGLLFIVSGMAQANCFGTTNNYSCHDLKSGNSYNVQKFGGTTNMQGYNANTGSTWSQNSNTFGNTTQIYGNTNGNAWNQTITPHSVYGTDSRGNSYNHQRQQRNGW
jgi:hypothetical protein